MPKVKWGTRCDLAAVLGIAVILAVVFLVPTSGNAGAKRGGAVVLAQQGHPPTLDPHFTGSGETRNVVTHMYESLVALDEKSSPIPDLAERYEFSTDGLTIIFYLRKGVKFHNGKEMKAADVKASLERYQKVSPNRALLAQMDSVTAVDDYTIAMKLKRRAPTIVEEMASPATVLGIMPAEDGQLPGGKNSNVGTGPYRLVEWVADSHIRLVRFEQYVPNQKYTQRDGYGGRKTAYFDTVTVRIVPESGARIAGLETGDYHVVEEIPASAAPSLAKNSNLRVYDMLPWWMLVGYMNTLFSPTNDIKIRQAIQAAANQEEIMRIATQGFFRLNHSLQYPTNRWYPGDGLKALYNQKNPAKAKQLMSEAKYNGTELTLITSSDFDSCVNAAVVLSEQLKSVGFKVQLRPVDHPTYNSVRSGNGGWNLAVCGNGIEPFLGAYAWNRVLYGKTNAMHVEDPALDAAWNDVFQKVNFEERKAGWRRVEERIFGQAYMVKLGDAGIKQAARATVKGFVPFRSPRMWDVWFE